MSSFSANDLLNVCLCHRPFLIINGLLYFVLHIKYTQSSAVQHLSQLQDNSVGWVVARRMSSFAFSFIQQDVFADLALSLCSQFSRCNISSFEILIFCYLVYIVQKRKQMSPFCPAIYPFCVPASLIISP